MRILQVTNGFPPTDAAGVEQYTYQLSRSLSAKHDVLALCRVGNVRRDDYDVIEDVHDGIPVRRVVNNFQYAFHVRDFYLNPQIELIFRQTVAEWRPDLIHFQHCIGLSASLLEAVAGLGIPYLLTLHDYWFLCSQVQLRHRRGHICPGPIASPDCYDCRMPPDGWLGPIRGSRPYQFLRRRLSDDAKRRILGLLARFSPRFTMPVPDEALSPYAERDTYMLARLRTVPLILTPSRFVREIYVQHGVPAERIEAVPLGLDMELWRGSSTVQPERSDGLRVGYFGTLLRHKGVHVLIEAFRRLEDPNASLRVYGFPVPGDPYIDELKRLAGQDARVQLMGRYQHRDLPASLSATDVIVIPSLWHETFSIIAREALLSGTPVVAAEVGALPEVIQPGENGLLVGHGDVEDLHSALASLATDPALLARLRQGARQSARDVKSMDAHVREIEAIYESLAREELLGIPFGSG